MQKLQLVDAAPPAQRYRTDGYLAYCDVNYYGKHIRNAHDKNDTHNVESVNADMRHFIAGLARRSRCFHRSIETPDAVVSVYIEAYNKFGAYKLKQHKSDSKGRHLHKYRELPLSALVFL